MNFYTGFFNVVGGGFNIGGSTNPGVGNAIITGALTIGGTTMPGAGNLALGAIPATALGSAYGGILMGNALIMAQKAIGAANPFILLNNAIHSGSLWIATSTAAATYYQQQSGFHTWATAPSVTAGNFLSFTEQMRLHLSGGLSLGSGTDPGAGNLALGGVNPTIKFHTTENTWSADEAGRIVGGAASGAAWAEGYLKFQTHGNNDANFTDDFVIKGKLFAFGGGAILPQSIIHVSSGGSTRGSILMSDDNTASLFLNWGNSLNGQLASDVGLDFRTGASYASGGKTGGVLVMRMFPSGGVNLGGTTDPGAGCLMVQNTLWVSGDAYVSLAGATSQQGFFIRAHDYDTGGSSYMGGGMFLNGASIGGTTAGVSNNSLFRIYAQNTTDMMFHSNGGQSFLFAPGNTLRMAMWNNGGVTIGGTTSPGAGNLALGEVPGTAFASSLSVISLSNVNIVTPKTIAANSYFYICNNMLFDGGTWRAISTDAGSVYYMQNGYHAWVNAASVTAGVPQSFQERMRLYLSGGLYVGTNPGGTDPGAGSIACTGVYKIGATQVVKGRIAGWGLPTGTLTRTALSNASTQAQFNQALMALITDLHATAGHGLIGT